MPTEESKPVKPVEPVADEADPKGKGKQAEVESEEEEDDDPATAPDETAAPRASTSTSKKKKSKRKKLKDALTRSAGDKEGGELKKTVDKLTPEQLKDLMALNPALAQEVAEASGTANPTPDQAAALLKRLDLQDVMTGLAAGGKNAKDMGSYKFWQTQPVPKFGDEAKVVEEGPLKIQTVEETPKDPAPLVAGFDWVTVDLTNEDEIKEVYELLNGHYVEDDEAMFRFNYSPAMLRWYAHHNLHLLYTMMQ
jgi:glycylpeptide N-tetradecanoyltransferase